MRMIASFVLMTGFVALSVAEDKKVENFESKEGFYKVAFPGKPKLTEQKQETKVGDLKIYNAVWRSADDTQYMSVSVTHLPFPKEKYDPQKGLNGAAKGGGGAGFKVTETKEIEFGKSKLPGRDVMSENAEKKLSCRGYLVFNPETMNLYQLNIIGSKDFVTGKETDAFIKSFELTGK